MIPLAHCNVPVVGEDVLDLGPSCCFLLFKLASVIQEKRSVEIGLVLRAHNYWVDQMFLVFCNIF